MNAVSSLFDRFRVTKSCGNCGNCGNCLENQDVSGSHKPERVGTMWEPKKPSKINAVPTVPTVPTTFDVPSRESDRMKRIPVDAVVWSRADHRWVGVTSPKLPKRVRLAVAAAHPEWDLYQPQEENDE